MCRVGGKEKTRKKKNFGSFCWRKEMYLYNNSCWARRKSLIIINRWGGKRTDNILERLMWKQFGIVAMAKKEKYEKTLKGGKQIYQQKLVFYIYIMISFHHRCVCVCVQNMFICDIRRGRKQLDPVHFFCYVSTGIRKCAAHLRQLAKKKRKKKMG